MEWQSILHIRRILRLACSVGSVENSQQNDILMRSIDILADVRGRVFLFGPVKLELNTILSTFRRIYNKTCIDFLSSGGGCHSYWIGIQCRFQGVLLRRM